MNEDTIKEQNVKGDRVLYIFLDEGGNLDFSVNGTKYFTITSVTKERPFYAFSDLTDLKYNLIENGTELEYFHASEDRQNVRNEVFKIINKHFKNSVIDSLIIEKRKTEPNLTSETYFYPNMLSYLLSNVLEKSSMENYCLLIIFTDSIPVKRIKESVEKSIKQVLAKILPDEIPYLILHHSSKSNLDLQIVDYCNWAIYRKWDTNDFRSFKLIERYIKSETEIFKDKTKTFY